MKSAIRLHARCAGAGLRTSFALSGTERKYERSRPFTIPHILLDLTLDLEHKRIEAIATIDFTRVAPDAQQLKLDAVGFELSNVQLSAGTHFSSVTYDYDGDQIVIQIPARVEAGQVRIEYRAEPRRGLYFLAPDAAVPERPVQVWTQCQDEDARHWFPCHDKPNIKMSTELRVSVPAGFVALSNGELIAEEKAEQRELWRYHFRIDEPHPSYLVTLVVGKFEILEDREADCADGNGRQKVPVRYYVPTGKAEEGRRSFRETPRMIELFSRLTGVAFPFRRYSQVVVSDFIFGGMENTTATTMYEHILLDAKAAVDVSSNELVAHELAHQWFGDYVTCRDWSHAWLNEGFATFFEHLEREDRLGRDEYDYGIAADIDSYLSEASRRYTRAIVCRDYQDPIDLFDRHLYEKGGLVLHMLRRELGDALFWRGVNAYLTTNRYALVETNDFQRALEAVSGRSLERFFDQWVYRAGHPVLKVKVSFEDGLLQVQVRQRQKTEEAPVFTFDLEVEIGERSGRTRRAKKTVTTNADTLVIALGERPKWVAFDPDLSVVGEVKLEAPEDMLQRQLEHGTNASIRWRAAEALARRDTVPAIAALEKALGNEDEVWMVRAEAARALGQIRGAACFKVLVQYRRTAHPKVRRAVVAALGNFRSPEALSALLPLMEDESYLVESEACRSTGRTRQQEAFDHLLAALGRNSWADVVRAGALDGLAELRNEAALETVMHNTRYGVPTRGRRAAIMALARLSDSRRVREHLEGLLDDADPHVRIDVVAALQSLGDPRCRPELRRRLDRELDGRVARRIREALREIGALGQSENKRLRDDLEALKNDLTELKVRLSKMEGGSKVKHAKPNGSKADRGSQSRKKAKTKKKTRARASKATAVKRTTLRSRASNERRPHPR